MLVASDIKALKAVAAGGVTRVYKADRNVLKAKGVSSRVLWRLDGLGLLTDGGPVWGCLERTCRQVLTDAGRAALAASE